MKGIEIISVSEKSLAEDAGIKPGDKLCRVNQRRIKDSIDYLFYCQDDILRLDIMRNNKKLSFELEQQKRDRDIGIELKPFRITRCKNNCIFCFVKQLPKGLRKTLYIRDDDYRLSFLFGNYITLTNLSEHARKRIITQKLSPLYVSVHATNPDVRCKLLNNPLAGNILEEINFFTSHKIRLHTQIVLCPGINDGEILAQTIKDLYKFYPYVMTIAVVPAGITQFSTHEFSPFSKEDALKTLEIVTPLSRRFKKRHGEPIVYAADEIYIQSNERFPPCRDYGEFEQFENGVGMLASFLHDLKKLRIPQFIKPINVSTLTGVSFWPYMTEAVEKFKRIEGLSLEAYRIENSFFGPQVTVTGLLTGRCIIKALSNKPLGDLLLLPDVLLRDKEDLLLDDVTVDDIAEILGVKVHVIDSTPRGMLQGIIEASRDKHN